MEVKHGVPGIYSGDLAVISHMIECLGDNGRMGVITSRNTLSRRDIGLKTHLIDNDMLEGVINLPSKLLPGTAISVSILVICRNKMKSLRGNVFFVNAAHDVTSNANSRCRLLDEFDFDKLASVYESKSEVPGYSKVVPTQDVAANQNDWSVQRYVSPSKIKITRLLKSYDQFGLTRIGDIIQSENYEGDIDSIAPKYENFIAIPDVRAPDSKLWVDFASPDEFHKFLSSYIAKRSNVALPTLRTFFRGS